MDLTFPALYTKEEVREIDKTAICAYAISGFALMERAGNAAFKVLRQRWPLAKSLAIFCGVGNNGGDGYILASLAVNAGYLVTVYQLGEPNKIQGDALLAYDKMLNSGINPINWQQQQIVAEVIVDAILGIGLHTPLSGTILAVVNAINATNIPVLALDIPTGLAANTGAVLGAAIVSALTVTFIAYKRGMFTGKARNYCGEIVLATLELEPAIYAKFFPQTIRLDFAILKAKLPKRLATAHKGQCGKVVIIGGAPSMGGAVQMAGVAALRVGAGLVQIITHSAHAEHITASCPELMCFGVEDPQELPKLLPNLLKGAIILLGPGLGQTPWSSELFRQILAYKLPMVIDADGLNLLAKTKSQIINSILTPHPGEAARLLATDIATIEANRFQALLTLAQTFNSTVVLKGAGTLVSYNDKIGVCGDGNASMATAGMGDILAGIIAGLWAQGLTAADAAACGVSLHAVAGDLVSNRGKYGMIATDLLPKLAKLCRRA